MNISTRNIFSWNTRIGRVDFLSRLLLSIPVFILLKFIIIGSLYPLFAAFAFFSIIVEGNTSGIDDSWPFFREFPVYGPIILIAPLLIIITRQRLRDLNISAALLFLFPIIFLAQLPDFWPEFWKQLEKLISSSKCISCEDHFLLRYLGVWIGFGCFFFWQLHQKSLKSIAY